MAQQIFMINDDVNTVQPDEGLKYDFETTYTEDTVRVQSGVMYITPLFTVESYGYSRKDLTADEMKLMLQKIAKGRPFKVHYFSAYYGAWRDDYFYVGKGSLTVGSWKQNDEKFDSLSFNMVGVNPL